MEFKFRAIDNIKPSPTSRSLSTVAYIPDRSLQLPSSLDGDFSRYRVPLVGEALRRELEKEQIRREIIAGEISRRRELEEEVRRELALERALGIPMQRPLSFQERLSPWSNHVASVDDRIGASTQQPFIMPLPPQITDNKDKVIVLAKPDPGLYNAKRKAMVPVVDDPEPSAFGLKKKSKEEWSCALCEIKATSESGLNAHLNGKKHKAKEAGHNIRKNNKSNKAFLSRMKTEKTVKATETIGTTKSGLDAKTDQQPAQPCIALGMMNETVVDKGVAESINVEKLAETMIDKGVTESKNEEQLVEINQNTGTLKNKKDTAIQEASKINAGTRKRKVERLWCEICQVGTFSQVVMEGHKKGKKHISKMKKFSQNNVSSPSTSGSEAPKLIKDTDGVNKETDQRITPVVQIETIFR